MRSKRSVDDALANANDPTVASGVVCAYDPERTVGYDAERTVLARADYDPEKTVGYDADRTVACLANDPDEPPPEHTELMDPAPLEETKRMDWTSAPMIALAPLRREALARASEPNISLSREVALSKTQRVTRVRSASQPWPLWVHIVLASAFVSCSIIFALLVFVA